MLTVDDAGNICVVQAIQVAWLAILKLRKEWSRNLEHLLPFKQIMVTVISKYYKYSRLGLG